MNKTFNRFLRALKKEVRKAFDRKQAVIDIERQLRSGTAVHDEEAKEVLRTEVKMPPEQIRLLEKLFTWPTSHSLNDEWRRRNAATKAVTDYCPVLEGGPLRGRPKRIAPSDGFDGSQTASRKRRASEEPKPDVHPPPSGPLQDAEVYIGAAKKPKRCFQCFGNRSLPEHRRVQKWSEYKSTLRHFRMKHLGDRKCNFCDIELLHEMHLRNHAAGVHRLVT